MSRESEHRHAGDVSDGRPQQTLWGSRGTQHAGGRSPDDCLPHAQHAAFAPPCSLLFHWGLGPAGPPAHHSCVSYILQVPNMSAYPGVSSQTVSRTSRRLEHRPAGERVHVDRLHRARVPWTKAGRGHSGRAQPVVGKQLTRLLSTCAARGHDRRGQRSPRRVPPWAHGAACAPSVLFVHFAGAIYVLESRRVLANYHHGEPQSEHGHTDERVRTSTGSCAAKAGRS